MQHSNAFSTPKTNTLQRKKFKVNVSIKIIKKYISHKCKLMLLKYIDIK